MAHQNSLESERFQTSEGGQSCQTSALSWERWIRYMQQLFIGHFKIRSCKKIFQKLTPTQNNLMGHHKMNISGLILNKFRFRLIYLETRKRATHKPSHSIEGCSFVRYSGNHVLLQLPLNVAQKYYYEATGPTWPLKKLAGKCCCQSNVGFCVWVVLRPATSLVILKLINWAYEGWI